MKIIESNMEIKVFEYNDELFGKATNHRIKLECGPRRNSETNTPTGIYFRWTYWPMLNNATIIRCVGEDYYNIKKEMIPELTADDIIILKENSYSSYLEKFKIKMKIINQPMPLLSFKIEPNTIESFLKILKS